jgi:hypothetical protein
MYEVILPKMGETMETGTIEKWLKKKATALKKEIYYMRWQQIRYPWK